MSSELPPPPDKITQNVQVNEHVFSSYGGSNIYARVVYNQNTKTISINIGAGLYTLDLDYPEKVLWDHMMKEFRQKSAPEETSRN